MAEKRTTKEQLIQELEAEPAYKVEFERLVANISTRFINLPFDEIDEGIYHALKEIGEFINVDRGNVWIFTEDLSKDILISEWVRESKQKYKKNPREVLLSPYRQLIDTFSERKVFQAASVEKLSGKHKNLKHLLQSFNVKSCVAVPLFQGDSLIGFIGIGTIHQEIVWSESTIMLMRIVAEIISNLLQRQKMEDELRRGEKHLRLALEAARVGTWEWDMQAEVLSISEGVMSLFGRSGERFGGKLESFLMRVHPEDIELVNNGISESVNHQVQLLMEFRVIWPDVSIRWLSIRGETYHDAKGRPVRMIGTIMDITDRKKSEEELLYRSEFQRIITGISTTFINLPSAEIPGEISRALETIGNFADADRSYVFIFTDQETELHLTYEWRREGISSIKDFVSVNMTIDNTQWLTNEIKKRETVYLPRITDLPEEAGADKEELKREGVKSLINVPIVLEKELIGLLGFDSVRSEKSWSQDNIALLRIVGDIFANALKRQETEGALKRYRDQLEELVEERTRELTEAQKELVRKERLAALGELTATVSHEIRNPLGTVRNAFFSIGDALKKNQAERVDRALTLAERNIQRCDRIINELLDYSRKKELYLELTDIGQWIENLLDEESLPEGVHKYLRLRAELELPIDREHMRRAVVNVVLNAAQALQEKGSAEKLITVETAVVKKRGEIRIVDNGPGIPDEIIERIFEPLFSTKNYGVGLGMAIVKDIMEEHQGGVEIESRTGKGTLVTLWLPLREPR